MIPILKKDLFFFKENSFVPCEVTEKQQVHNIQRKDDFDSELPMLMMLKEHIYKTSAFSC